MNIPDFASNGALPPFIEDSPTNPAKRSPYKSDIFGLVDRFCTSKARALLLYGLNAYREHLFKGGFVNGYQWIDGSFVEDVENKRGRPPRDIDLVTLFYRPIVYQNNDASYRSDYKNILHAKYFEPRIMKSEFNCDTYGIDLESGHSSLVQSTIYFQDLFTDIRNSTEKKGIIEIPLPNDPMEFAAVSARIGGKSGV